MHSRSATLLVGLFTLGIGGGIAYNKMKHDGNYAQPAQITQTEQQKHDRTYEQPAVAQAHEERKGDEIKSYIESVLEKPFEYGGSRVKRIIALADSAGRDKVVEALHKIDWVEPSTGKHVSYNYLIENYRKYANGDPLKTLEALPSMGYDLRYFFGRTRDALSSGEFPAFPGDVPEFEYWDETRLVLATERCGSRYQKMSSGLCRHLLENYIIESFLSGDNVVFDNNCAGIGCNGQQLEYRLIGVSGDKIVSTIAGWSRSLEEFMNRLQSHPEHYQRQMDRLKRKVGLYTSLFLNDFEMTDEDKVKYIRKLSKAAGSLSGELFQPFAGNEVVERALKKTEETRTEQKFYSGTLTDVRSRTYRNSERPLFSEVEVDVATVDGQSVTVVYRPDPATAEQLVPYLQANKNKMCTVPTDRFSIRGIVCSSD